MNTLIKDISYETILPLWKKYLWPEQQDSWRPISTLNFEGKIDLCIKANYSPLFWGLFHDESLAAVNSGHFCSPVDFRSRGLLVLPEFRGVGFGARLLQHTIQYAQKNGAKRIWSYPRNTAWNTYEEVGFHSCHRAIGDNSNNSFAFILLSSEQLLSK